MKSKVKEKHNHKLETFVSLNKAEINFLLMNLSKMSVFFDNDGKNLSESLTKKLEGASNELD